MNCPKIMGLTRAVISPGVDTDVCDLRSRLILLPA